MVLDKILFDTGGWKVPFMSTPDMENYTLSFLLRLGHKNLNMVYGGIYEGAFLMLGPPDVGASHAEEITQLKREWEKKGAIVESGGDSMVGGVGGMGGGGYSAWEAFTHFDPAYKQSTEGTSEWFEASFKFGKDRGWPPGMERGNSLSRGADGKIVPEEIRRQALSHSLHATALRYQQKIKELLNPNDLGDAYYLTLKD